MISSFIPEILKQVLDALWQSLSLADTFKQDLEMILLYYTYIYAFICFYILIPYIINTAYIIVARDKNSANYLAVPQLWS